MADEGDDDEDEDNADDEVCALHMMAIPVYDDDNSLKWQQCLSHIH